MVIYMIKIIFINLLVFLFLPILFYSCSEEGYDCNVCGDPERCFYVTIVDTIGIPVNSLSITVTDHCGNILYTPQDPFSSSLGKYTLIDGEYVDLYQVMTSCGPDFKFSATDGTRSLDTTFTFRTSQGTCYCEYPWIVLDGYANQPVLVIK